MPKKRKVIIGLDGMPFELMSGFAQDGTMPNFGMLAQQGVLKSMTSSIPEVSSVAWSSIITGANPGEHGIYGFTDIAPGTYRLTFPNFDTLQVRPFWERKKSGRTVVINVPTTYPAREMNGVLVAGFVALDLERATFPRSLVPKLQELDYRVDVDSQKAHKSLSFFLQDVQETLQARIAAYRYLWDEADWDTFVLTFTGTDRLAHFLWDAYEDQSHQFHSAFVEHFRQIDKVIGEIVRRLSEKDSVIIISDHGFERLERNIFINYLLMENGFLVFKDGAAPHVRAIAEETKAFALDPGRIYIHLKGKYPRGCVECKDEQAVTEELEALFSSLTIQGNEAIKHIYRGRELYKGAQAHRAPDLVLLGNNGCNLRSNMKATQLWGTDLFTGKHSQANAFLLIWGDFESYIVPEAPSVADIVPILTNL